jgi:hypothetical protein
MKKIVFSIISIAMFFTALAQPNRWQQKVKYNMAINMDVVTNTFTGTQKLEYTNNAPESITKLFYHLYYNAFQPNSSMDVRSRELGKNQINNRPDWDPRVKDRISKLKEDEIGYQKINSITINGIAQPFIYHETILEVKLTTPILPKSKVVIDMQFQAQVPLQIRRTGRDNPNTTVRYSMSQWYPKLCEYDYEGWHPTPYVAREFYGVWGDFDVTIAIDKNYKLGGTGVLVNAAEIGWGYDVEGSSLKDIKLAKRSWHFVGNTVHDFVWAADEDYKHISRKMPNNGPTLHVIYKNKDDKAQTEENWKNVADAAVTVLPFIEQNFGKYPYPQYSFILGGDGGMEYPMATLIAGPGLGTVFHEWMHSWYQMMLGTNESMYGFMDEGFTEYATDLVENYYENKVTRVKLAGNIKALKTLDSNAAVLPLLHNGNYQSYYYIAKSPYEEPLTTHADHFNTNLGYSIASYSKGCVLLEQLGYIIGAAKRDTLLLEYYKQWRFKHPNASDFFKIAETVSDQKLDWYKEYWCSTTKKIDYAIDSLWEEDGLTKIRIKKLGQMPMPIDVKINYKDGSTEMHYMPLNIQYGQKPNENEKEIRVVHEPWRWTHPTYTFETKKPLATILKVEIDPSKRMADVDQRNNILDIKW